MLEIRMLGQFEVRLDGRVASIPSRPAQSLLAYLALTAGTAHRREKLSGLFWPESTEANARSSLRHALWRLRGAVGGDQRNDAPYLLVDNFTIAFTGGDQAWVDALALAEEPAGERTLDDLIAAVSAYGGQLLPGFYEDWVILERERLRSIFENRMQSLLDRCLAERRWSLALEWAERWIAMGDVPEPAFRSLMIAHNGLGDVARVVATYKRCREALEGELGVPPSEQTRATYAWLIEGGPQPPGVLPPARAAEEEGLSQAPAASDAAELLLERWAEQGKEILDVASLVLIHRAEGGGPIADRHAQLLIRSVLHHNIDADPWVARLASSDAAVEALVETYDRYGEPQIRRRIVGALADIDGDPAGDALTRIVLTEGELQVREAAALAVARRGQGQALMPALASQLGGTDEPSAMAAFVAIADEAGRPADLGPYPRWQVNLALLRRRWRRWQAAIWNQTLWALVGSALALALRGTFEPLLLSLASPESFEFGTEFQKLSAGMFSGFMAGLIIGAFHGAAIGFAVGLSDAMDPRRRRPGQRLFSGAAAGLIYAAFFIVFALLEFKAPEAEAVVYVPALLLFGLSYGAILTLVIPYLGATATVRRQWMVVGRATAMVFVVVLLFNFVVYRPVFWISVIRDLSSNLAQMIGLAMFLSQWNRRYQAKAEPVGY